MIMSDAAEMLLRVSDQHRLHWQWTQNITGPSREYHAFHSPQNLRPPGRLPPPGDPDSPAFRAESGNVPCFDDDDRSLRGLSRLGICGHLMHQDELG